MNARCEVAYVVERGNLGRCKIDAERSFDVNDQPDLREAIPTVHVICNEIRRRNKRIVVEDLANDAGKPIVNGLVRKRHAAAFSKGFAPDLSEAAVMLRSLFALTALAFIAAVDPTSGTVVVAKTQGNAIVLWDVTHDVSAIVAEPGTTDAKMHEVEVAAAKILLARLGEVPAATSVEVRVVYQETGEASQFYRANTFGGVEKLLVVSASREAAAHNKDAWTAQLAKNELPAGVTASVTGALPPP